MKNRYQLSLIKALPSWSKCQIQQEKEEKIAAPLTSMLKTSGSTESTTRPGKGGVEVGGDGGETLTLRLRTSKSTDSSTKTTQIAVKYDGVDSDVGKSAEESSKSRRIVKKSEKP